MDLPRDPHIGDTLWYRPGIFDFSGSNALGFEDDGPLAALVVAVHSPVLVNLVVFTRRAETVRRLHIALLAPDQPKPNHGHAEWPQFNPPESP